MNNSAMQKLLDRYLSGACSTEEQLKVEQWLEQQQNAGNEWTEMDAPAKAAWMALLYQDVQDTIDNKAVATKNATAGKAATPVPADGTCAGAGTDAETPSAIPLPIELPRKSLRSIVVRVIV